MAQTTLMTQLQRRLPAMRELIECLDASEVARSELHNRHWVAAELTLLIEQAIERRAALLGEESPRLVMAGPPMKLLEELLEDLHSDAEAHRGRYEGISPTPDSAADAWWDEGYRCGVLSAIADLGEVGVSIREEG